MSVNQLSSKNFSLTNTGRTKNLNINLGGVVLCFFKMDSCPGCNSFDPIFRQLSLENQNISYAIINLTSSRDIVTMSRDSTTPITSVPFLLLFINGNPHAKYNGQKTITALKSFINKALQHAPRIAENVQSFMPGQYADNKNQHINPITNPSHNPNYSQQGNQPRFYAPDIMGGVPQQNTNKFGNSQNNNSQIEELEEETDDKLTIPPNITPYNVPWELHYKKLNRL
jgi:thiol-disulfide isomerase/thioredoxin